MAFLGFGQEQPFAAAEQNAQDRQTAFQGIKDNLPALGLVMGLSMLARNNGTRSAGQLIGQGGADALNAYGTWQKIQEAKARQEKEDQWKLEDREYSRSQDAFKNSMEEKKFALDEMKTRQDMAIAQQRLRLAAAGVAAQRQAMALAAAKEREKEEFNKNHKQVDGVWWDLQPDGTWAESKTLNMYDANGNRIGAKQPELPKYSDVSKFMGDYQGATSDYNASGDALSTLYVGATQDNAFGDMDMIYALNKMYDPRSVVRGEEFKQMAMAGGLPAQVVNFYNQVANGKRLTPEQRKQMVKIAYDLFEERAAKKNQYDEQFRTIAKPYNYNTNAIIQDLHAGTRNKARKYLSASGGTGAGGTPAVGAPQPPVVPGRSGSMPRQPGGPGGAASPSASALPPGFKRVN